MNKFSVNKNTTSFFPKVFYLIVNLTVLASSHHLCAQKKMPGYIVTVRGDTIRGLIVDRTDADLSKKVDFVNGTKTSLPASYSAKDLLGFGFDYGRKFQRQKFATQFPAGDSALVFAKQVIRGKIDLLIWRRPKKNEGDMFLFNNHSQKKVHLTEPQPEIIISPSGSRKVKKDKRYIQLLRFIKGDSVQEKKLRYVEKSLIKDILSYNQRHDNQFPVTFYREKKIYNFDLRVGIPVEYFRDETNYRVSVYMNKIYPEQSRRFSYFKGLSYRLWRDEQPFDRNVAFDSRLYRQQFLSIIPIGFNYHGSSRLVRPFIYAGVGLGTLREESQSVENFSYSIKTQYKFFPTLNAGIGVRLKAGPGFIAAEITPSVDGIFFNFGLSI